MSEYHYTSYILVCGVLLLVHIHVGILLRVIYPCLCCIIIGTFMSLYFYYLSYTHVLYHYCHIFMSVSLHVIYPCLYWIITCLVMNFVSYSSCRNCTTFKCSHHILSSFTCSLFNFLLFDHNQTKSSHILE